MTDKRSHRGKHPQDDTLFSDANLPALQQAVSDLSWLLSHGYGLDSALKLVGDRHDLTARQRMAVRRSTCSDQSLRHRRTTEVSLQEAADSVLGIDAYNLLITIESAISGGAIFIGCDGCYRDLASLHGTYRKVEETVPAINLIIDHLAEYRIRHVDWYLDKPVSNSGRLKTLLAEILEQRHLLKDTSTTWNIELADSPDRLLIDYDGIVVSHDSVILDRCRSWTNLSAAIINRRVPYAWKRPLVT